MIKRLRKRLAQVGEVGYDIGTFFLGLFYAWRSQEDIDKCLAGYAAETKLREIIAGGRERIERIIKEKEHGEVDTKQADYIRAVGIRPPYKCNGTETSEEIEDLVFGHQYTAEAGYRDVENAYEPYVGDDEEIKELIRIEIDVFGGGCRGISRYELLNTKDLTLYEKPL